MFGVGQHHVLLDRLEPLGELFQDRHESEVDHHHAVLGVIDDPGDLIGKQPRIDGVIDRADAHDAVPGFEVPPGIPSERRHAVAELDAAAVEPLRHPQRAHAQIGVIRGVERAFDRTADDLPPAVLSRGVIEDAMAQ